MCRGNGSAPPPSPNPHAFCPGGGQIGTYYVCMLNTIGQSHEATIEACDGNQALAIAQQNYIGQTWYSLGHCLP